jgi:hypothetical protein
MRDKSRDLHVRVFGIFSGREKYGKFMKNNRNIVQDKRNVKEKVKIKIKEKPS